MAKKKRTRRPCSPGCKCAICAPHAAGCACFKCNPTGGPGKNSKFAKCRAHDWELEAFRAAADEQGFPSLNAWIRFVLLRESGNPQKPA